MFNKRNVSNDYTIEISSTFTVTINHSTYMDEIKAFEKAKIDGFQFQVIQYGVVKISVTPQSDMEQVDKTFRNACAMFTKYRLTTRELEEILSAYEAHLKRNGVQSPSMARKCLNGEHPEPNFNCSF